MRSIIAFMKQETNTFSPVPTGLEHFRERVLCSDEETPATLEGAKNRLGRLSPVDPGCRADIVTPVAAEASPSCPVEVEAYSRIMEAIRDGTGVTSSGNALFNFGHVRPPIHPLHIGAES